MKLARRAHRVRIRGFRFAGVRCGLKARGPDVALIVAEPPATAAGVFTTNRAAAAPVQIARRRLRSGRLAAVLVHAGNANACTGAGGLRTAEAATALAAELLRCRPEEVAPCATGRIGVSVERRRLLAGVRAAVAHLRADGLPAAARAITTTDAFPKTAVRRCRLGAHTATVAALGKGAGMIAPDMATLLVFVVTDARMTSAAARQTLRAAVTPTLNAITVDGDTSTNDTTLLLASGAAGNAPVRPGSRAHARLTAAVREVLAEVAQLIVADGEGSTRLVEVRVDGARSVAAARRVARAIAGSTLCKAAFHGGDPNWGRFVSAAGTAGVAFDPERADVSIGGVRVARRGRPVPRALPLAAARMRRPRFDVTLHLHLGSGSARMLTADLSPAYVRFNAAYTT
jgi:glutamate N-acetyltransferase/amino-acid N-acetyltransferase